MKREIAAESELHLMLANNISEIPALNDEVDAFTIQAGMPETRRLDVRLALEELVVNVMRYAWDCGTHEIAVVLTLAGQEIRARIEDDGRPFNPIGRPPFEPDTPIEQRGEGGLGIHLARQLTDERAYERHGSRNILQIAFRWVPPCVPER